MAAKALAGSEGTQWAEYYKQIVEKCPTKALQRFWLADLYLEGRGVEQSSQYTIHYLIKAMLSGVDEEFPPDYKGSAEAALGALYLTAGYPDVSQDLPKAFQWISKGAEKGHFVALSTLGLMHGAGFGVPRDEEKAIELLLKGINAYTPSFEEGARRSLTTGCRSSLNENLSAKMVRARELFWEALEAPEAQRTQIFAEIGSLSGSSSSLVSVAYIRSHLNRQSSGLRFQKAHCLKCDPENSAGENRRGFRMAAKQLG